MALSLRYYRSAGVAGSFPPVGGTPYADLVASLGAVSYWPLQSDAVDTIGAHNLTLAGSPAFGAAGPGGELATALTLVAASNQWGSVSHADLRPTTALTVCGWVKVNTHTNGTYLWSCGNTGFQGYNARLNTTYNGVTATVKNGTDTSVDTVGNDQPGTVWCFVAMTYDKANLRLYVENGTEDTGGPDAATFDIGYSSNTFYVGTINASTTNDLDGLVAGIAVFPTALSAANVLSLSEAI